MAKAKIENEQLVLSRERQTRAVPPDPEDMNEERAQWADEALEAFTTNTGQYLAVEPADVVNDLITDIAHWCDRNKLQLSGILIRAIEHYGEETDGKGKQFRGVTITNR